MIGRFMTKLWALHHRFWTVVTGAEIPLECEIGGGLLLPHPNGIVIHPDCRIGPNCLIFQQVTLGGRKGPGTPLIAGHVDIGPGARILGDVRIGEHSVVGANAVVLSSFPAGSVIVGIPGKRTGEAARIPPGKGAQP